MRNPAILWGTLVDAVRKARKNCKRDPFYTARRSQWVEKIIGSKPYGSEAHCRHADSDNSYKLAAGHTPDASHL